MAKIPYPAIPQPTADVGQLMRTVEQLKKAVDMLTRQAGDERAWPLTVSEARRLGVIGPTAKLPDAPDR